MASDSDSDEDFVTYGIPLEPLEEDEPLKRPVPLHDQTVKDEKGRYQRFHGAFTGGFSAGYFNTVGTKEGWTPSTFLSSRQQKAEKKNARPEDFMDDEDLGEHGIAPSEITTTDEFASRRRDQIRDKARAITSMSAPIPGDTLLEDLVTPAKSSMGVELLRKMGWKDGQGVGPRVKRKALRQKEEPARKGYGCVLPPNGSEESEEDDGEFAPADVTFAPKDVVPIDFTPKVDVKGLGYQGLNPQQALMGGGGSGNINLFTMDSDRASSLFGDNRKGPKRRGGVAGQAFGVGAMEDDDDDIYHRDTMSNYDKVLGGEEPGDGLYGWTAPQQYKKKKDYSIDASYIGKILEGFTLSSEVEKERKIFPPPILPRDYRPVHYFRPVVDMSSVSPIVAQALKTSRGHMAQQQSLPIGRHQLYSAHRRDMLGESALQGPSSVFDLLKSEDREKLASLRNTTATTPSTGPGPASSAPSGGSHSAMVSAGVAAAAARASAQKAMAGRFQPPGEQEHRAVTAAWSGPTAQAQAGLAFKPFEKNPSKQARYELYINQIKQGDKDALEQSLDPAMTEWERGRERDEFVRAALLYKPSSSSLSSRFTRGKTEEIGDKVEVTRDQENDVDDKQAAVKMKMFGKLTRDTFEWHPDTLLCKRFNIPDPYPGSGIVGMPKVKRDKFSVFNFLTVLDSPTAATGPPPPASSKPSEPGKRSRWDQSVKAEEEKDPLSQFLSAARSEASGVSGASGASGAQDDPATSASTPDPATKEQEQQEAGKEEEEEEEESRPSMDLFKAIFVSSSDEKSSSSEEEEEEEGEEEGEGGRGTADSVLASLFNINNKPAAASSLTQAKPDRTELTSTKAQTAPAAPAPAGSAPDASAPPSQEEEEFGPRLPPPSSIKTEGSRPSLSPSAKLVKHKKKCKEKHKAKKVHKHKKEKKQKKKQKKQKHKGKKKSKKEVIVISSSDGSETDSEEDGDSGGPSTEELLKRLKNISGQK
ncbi:G patch domain-containing protein 1 isoform X1 [Osmerus mordax]|uniref:G patch domain-containing protein 1 isoform X1 n=1 Tax=Osmerus mordax TaxID=8014 RepID=UPI003510243F